MGHIPSFGHFVGIARRSRGPEGTALSPGSRERRWSASVLFLLTSVAWAAVVAAAGWVLVAVGWWLIARIWLTRVFVPGAVALTARLFLCLAAWALVVFALAEAWRHRDYHRYHLRERRALAPLPRRAGAWTWAEAELDAAGARFSVVARREGPAAGGGVEGGWRDA